MGWEKGKDGEKTLSTMAKGIRAIDLEKGHVPGIMISVFRSSKGVMGQREQILRGL